MTIVGLLRVLVPASAAFSLAALIFQVGRTLAAGRPAYLSAPRGEPRKGVAYAFGRGMIKKESVTLHRPSFGAGVLYHGAVFCGFAEVFRIVFAPRLGLAPLLRWGLRAVLAAGAAAGLALLVKRTVKPALKRLSCPEDFFANIAVDAFLVLVLARTLIPGLEPVLLGAAVLLFLYIPFGKIRHCAYFFYTRLIFGIHFGRRGALPGPVRGK